MLFRSLPDAVPCLRVVTADALTIDGPDVLGAGLCPTRLVANLPYNVAVPVLLILLAALPAPESRSGAV